MRTGGPSNNIDLPSICTQLTVHLERLRKDRRLSTWREHPATGALAAQIFAYAKSVAPHDPLANVLGERGLLLMFPLLAETLCGLPDAREGTTAGDYIKRIAALNQLAAVAHQLRRDAASHATQKYLAHQIALLYVRSCSHNSPLPAAAFWLTLLLPGYTRRAASGRQNARPQERTKSASRHSSTTSRLLQTISRAVEVRMRRYARGWKRSAGRLLQRRRQHWLST
jgi:hypothetical protein